MLYYNVRFVQCVPKMRINSMTHLFVCTILYGFVREKNTMSCEMLTKETWSDHLKFFRCNAFKLYNYLLASSLEFKNQETFKFLNLSNYS